MRNLSKLLLLLFLFSINHSIFSQEKENKELKNDIEKDFNELEQLKNEIENGWKSDSIKKVIDSKLKDWSQKGQISKDEAYGIIKLFNIDWGTTPQPKGKMKRNELIYVLRKHFVKHPISVDKKVFGLFLKDNRGKTIIDYSEGRYTNVLRNSEKQGLISKEERKTKRMNYYDWLTNYRTSTLEIGSKYENYILCINDSDENIEIYGNSSPSAGAISFTIPNTTLKPGEVFKISVDCSEVPEPRRSIGILELRYKIGSNKYANYLTIRR